MSSHAAAVHIALRLEQADTAQGLWVDSSSRAEGFHAGGLLQAAALSSMGQVSLHERGTNALGTWSQPTAAAAAATRPLLPLAVVHAGLLVPGLRLYYPPQARTR